MNTNEYFSVNLETLKFNTPLAIAYAMALYAFMWFGAKTLLKSKFFLDAITPPDGRFGAIDGMRGCLAISVMVHHTIAASGYFTDRKWDFGACPFFNQLGKCGVAMFFMITGFIFTRKAMGKKISWFDFYRARFLRLFPLYFVVTIVVFIIAFQHSGWRFNEPISTIATEFLQWVTFVVYNRPPINSMHDSHLIIAGVNWSLKYEVFFYSICFPLIYILARKLPANQLLLCWCSTILVLSVLRLGLRLDFHPCYFHFAAGVFLGILIQSSAVLVALRSDGFRVLFFASLIGIIFTESVPYVTLLLLTVILASVVSGEDCFGLLNSKEAIWLGDLSYGIYLIHGIVLWLSFGSLSQNGYFSRSDLLSFFAIVLSVCSLVLFLSAISYVLLEKPLSRLGRKTVSKIAN